jgi:hypothetical protein
MGSRQRPPQIHSGKPTHCTGAPGILHQSTEVGCSRGSLGVGRRGYCSWRHCTSRCIRSSRHKFRQGLPRRGMPHQYNRNIRCLPNHIRVESAQARRRLRRTWRSLRWGRSGTCADKRARETSEMSEISDRGVQTQKRSQHTSCVVLCCAVWHCVEVMGMARTGW